MNVSVYIHRERERRRRKESLLTADGRVFPQFCDLYNQKRERESAKKRVSLTDYIAREPLTTAAGGLTNLCSKSRPHNAQYCCIYKSKMESFKTNYHCCIYFLPSINYLKLSLLNVITATATAAAVVVQSFSTWVYLFERASVVYRTYCTH
jgi:hypothetical protein